MVDALDVIALVSVAALGNGNDRVTVIHAVNGRAPPSRFSLVRSSDGIDHVHAADHVPERGHVQGNANVQGSGHVLQNRKRNVINHETASSAYSASLALGARRRPEPAKTTVARYLYDS